MVAGGISIHLEQLLAEEVGIWVLHHNLGHLSLDVLEEECLVGIGITVGMGIAAFEQVERDEVGRIQTVVAVYLSVEP